jgi:hypothetical protein
MDEIGNEVLLKVKRDKVKQIDIHRVVGEIRPFNFIESTIFEPELGNS